MPSPSDNAHSPTSEKIERGNDDLRRCKGGAVPCNHHKFTLAPRHGEPALVRDALSSAAPPW